MKITRTITAAVTAAVLLAGLSACSIGKTDIEKAAETCEVTSAVEDGGDTISFDTQGTDDLGGGVGSDDYEDVACVMSELDVPTSITQRMDNTRSLDGMQDGTWDDFEASWNYHPDDGLWLTVTAV